jgi:hypothetical protein
MNMSKLDGVNRVLRAAKEHPIAVLGSSTENDSLMAEQILDEVSQREQLMGLMCNTTSEEYTPDDNNSNRVILPTNTLQVQGNVQNASRLFAMKWDDGVLYLTDTKARDGVENDEFDNDSTIFLRITVEESFENLPVHHQFSIADQAAVEYQQGVLGSRSMDRALQERAMRSRAVARQYEMRVKGNNQFQHGKAQGPRATARYTPRAWPFNDTIPSW